MEQTLTQMILQTFKCYKQNKELQQIKEAFILNIFEEEKLKKIFEKNGEEAAFDVFIKMLDEETLKVVLKSIQECVREENIKSLIKYFNTYKRNKPLQTLEKEFIKDIILNPSLNKILINDGKEIALLKLISDFDDETLNSVLIFVDKCLNVNNIFKVEYFKNIYEKKFYSLNKFYNYLNNEKYIKIYSKLEEYFNINKLKPDILQLTKVQIKYFFMFCCYLWFNNKEKQNFYLTKKETRGIKYDLFSKDNYFMLLRKTDDVIKKKQEENKSTPAAL